MKFTEWYPASVKPVRKGVYIAEFAGVAFKSKPWYAHWNGINWTWMAKTPKKSFIGAEKRVFPRFWHT